MGYTVVHFNVDPILPGNDVLTAILADYAFDSFEETEEGLKAYIESQFWSNSLEQQLRELSIPQITFSFTTEELANINWNAEWESQFDPIEVGDKCYIRAPFHEEKTNVLNVVIEPKMSFGTGHHATTYLMTEACFELDLKDKMVVDMGSGTAVLAIVAEKLGAKNVLAIDIDEWAFENAIENVERNGCSKIHVKLGEVEHLKNIESDVFLANINRNILVNQCPMYTQVCKPKSKLLLSGFYETDVSHLLQAFSKFKEVSRKVKDNWCMLVLERI